MGAERPLEKKELKPEREAYTPDGFRWFVYSAEGTTLRLVCLEDLTTGVIVTTALANPEIRTAAQRAWAGARHSRSSGMSWEIMAEMHTKGVDPDQKLEEMFRNYGHASVGDMARLEVDVVSGPLHLNYGIFSDTAINSGQEKSTRFQPRFGKAVLHPVKHYLPESLPEEELSILETAYQEFGKMSLSLFAKYKELLTKRFKEFYRPQDEKQQSSLDSRVLDCVRYFLLFGQNSGLSIETSARDWSRMIGEFKASPLPFYRRFAYQLEKLLAPTVEEEEMLGFKAEAPSLIRHTEAAATTNNNLLALKTYIGETDLLDTVSINTSFPGRVSQKVELLPNRYTEGEKMTAQYLLRIYPGLDRKELMEWVHGQSDKTKKELSGIIFAGHNNYHELPPIARTTGMTLQVDSYLGEMRDLNRHRAYGRDTALPLIFGLPMDFDTVNQIMASGFGLPLYLTDVPEMADLEQEFEKDLCQYYQKLYNFVGAMHDKYGDEIDYSFVINLLPLAHQVTLYMHGDPKQGLYMTHQRVRNGGHINYRDLAYQANELLSNSDPLLSGMEVKSSKPDPADREEFFDRS